MPTSFSPVFLFLGPKNVFDDYGTDHGDRNHEPTHDEKAGHDAAEYIDGLVAESFTKRKSGRRESLRIPVRSEHHGVGGNDLPVLGKMYE